MTEQLSLKALQVILVGEHLRNRLHSEEDPVMIRDRRYHLRMYSCCFVGRDLVDWLIRNGDANSRGGAVQCMNVLFENSIIHHVCDDHQFKDEMLFYRFRRDDDTAVLNPDLAVVYKGCDIYYRAKNEDCHQLSQARPRHDFVYRSCFTGRELVDWLIQHGEVSDRAQGVLLGRELLDQAIIKHVTDEFHFRDENIFYQFMIDRAVNKKMTDALGIVDDKTPGSPRNFRRRNLPPLNTQRSSPVPFSKERPGMNEPYDYKTSPDSPDYFPSSGSPSQSPRPVIVREITTAELLDPNGPYVTKNIRVKSDAVGFGFVVRGSSPVYIQTVDPKGPAAAAGLKVRMYLKCVNGKDVLYWTHREVSQEILRGQNIVNLVVMTHFKGAQ